MVVSLLMIAVAFVTVRMDMLLPQTRMEACARNLAADIGNARASAIAQGLLYSLEYDVRNSQYRIATPFRVEGGLATDDTNRVFLNWNQLPEGVKIQEIMIGNVLVRDGIRRIDIKPNGNTIEHVVHMRRDLPPGDFYLVVQGLTGFVQFFHGKDWISDTPSEADFP